MALDVDGFAVLAAIGANPQTFAELRAEINKTARALVARQLKSKALELEGIRALRSAVGVENLALILDLLPDLEIVALAMRFDKHNEAIKLEGPAWRRQHLEALMDGSVQPMAKATAARKTTKKAESSKLPKASEPKAPEVLSYRSAGRTKKK